MQCLLHESIIKTHEINFNCDFVKYLKVWNAVSTTTDLKKFSLINMSYNGVQNAGTVFNTVGFNVWYPSSNAFPTITSIVFNGVNVCSTATVPPTTTFRPTTKTTKATITTTTTTRPTTTTKAATTITTSPTSVQPIFYFVNSAKVIFSPNV
jgi:hypothetical protein